MTMASLSLFLLLFTSAPPTAASSPSAYRHYHVDNADICNKGKITEKSKTLNLGDGAAIFQLNQPSQEFQPNYRNKAQRCEIHIKVPEEQKDSLGLMAYVEEMNLRENSKNGHCVDYVQFGQDDMLPFVTLKKSDKFCGERDGKEMVSKGIFYDDPHGNLLVWISLGGRRETSTWPSISVVNLTLVVTTYQKECKRPRQNYVRCGDRERCVWKHYFCDGHFNCGNDVVPKDESNCKAEADGDGTTQSPDNRGGGGDDGSLNSISQTLVIICGGLGFLLVLILCLRHRKNKKCCSSSQSVSGGSCELPENQPRSLAELNRTRHLRETEDNIYSPLSQTNQPPPTNPVWYNSEAARGGGVAETSLPSSGPPVSAGPPPDEPPPAYNDLFPEVQTQPPQEEAAAAETNIESSSDAVET